ncbi:MAG: hypothetical protein M5U19_04930 [Microthrixaceae bacterium]|nr:hypothetical protein [Microthrixaceae bacterium]
MSSFGFVLHERLHGEDLERTLTWLVDRGHQGEPAGKRCRTCRSPRPRISRGRVAVGLDLVVSMGGDGTMLRAAGLAVSEDVPGARSQPPVRSGT